MRNVVFFKAGSALSHYALLFFCFILPAFDAHAEFSTALGSSSTGLTCVSQPNGSAIVTTTTTSGNQKKIGAGKAKKLLVKRRKSLQKLDALGNKVAKILAKHSPDAIVGEALSAAEQKLVTQYNQNHASIFYGKGSAGSGRPSPIGMQGSVLKALEGYTEAKGQTKEEIGNTKEARGAVSKCTKGKLPAIGYLRVRYEYVTGKDGFGRPGAQLIVFAEIEASQLSPSNPWACWLASSTGKLSPRRFVSDVCTLLDYDAPNRSCPELFPTDGNGKSLFLGNVLNRYGWVNHLPSEKAISDARAPLFERFGDEQLFVRTDEPDDCPEVDL